MIKVFYAVLFSLWCANAAAQVFGCTDPLATNYNAAATSNDGSYVYAAATVSVSSSVVLDNAMSETSGLLRMNNLFWTHNDNADVTLFAIDTTDGSVAQTCALPGLVTVDWEDVQQDADYVYIGDFGNNSNGNRTDLRILRVEKQNLCTNALVDTIAFTYNDQTDFTPAGSENTDFDCEAFVVTSDSIYLFTKQWVSLQTSVYALPKTPGNAVAQKRGTYNVNGLVTGAALLDDERLVALCGYDPTLQPFVFLLYDYAAHNFFSGNKRRLSLNLPFHQIESIATTDGLHFHLTNEAFATLSVPAKFHTLDLQSYTETFLSVHTDIADNKSISIYPNPTEQNITLLASNGLVGETVTITNATGYVVTRRKMDASTVTINVDSLLPGVYVIAVAEQRRFFVKQ